MVAIVPSSAPTPSNTDVPLLETGRSLPASASDLSRPGVVVCFRPDSSENASASKSATIRTSPSTNGEIVDLDLSIEMRTSFLEHAYSVIYARTLPDARDGLEPVQRRILFQMDRMGLRPDRPRMKSSRVVGDIMGRFHPHGDTAIYEALVRLAQPFAMRLPLIDGHSNFDSLDDGPAAPRYTEARLTASALALTADLDEDTVDFAPNYDYTLTGPEVLPAAFPSLPVNGAAGIAVGMATNMLSHNLVEVVVATRHLLTHPEMTLEELMAFAPGPDLPAGSMIVGLDGIRKAYRTGRGKSLTRVTAHVGSVSPRRKGIAITELPYMVGPEKIIARIKEAVDSKKLRDITDVADLTGRKHGTRLVISVKNDYNPEAILAQLYKHTSLEGSLGINSVSLVDGQPHTLGLCELPEVFVRHHLTVVTQRTRFRLGKRREHAHLVNGLLIAILDIDEVTAVIRSSDDTATTCTRLMQVFNLTEPQAGYILELQLRRLTKFSVIELEKKRDELAREIEALEAVLADNVLLRRMVSRELAAMAERLDAPRCTALLETSGEHVTLPAAAETVDGVSVSGRGVERAGDAAQPMTPMPSASPVPLTVPGDPCRVLLSATGLVARTAGTEPVARIGGCQPHSALTSQVATTARGRIGAVTDTGRLVLLGVVSTTEILHAKGAPGLVGTTQVRQLVDIEPEEKVMGLVPVGSADSPPIVLVTIEGVIKRVKPGDEPRNAESWEVISLFEGDRVVFAGTAADTDFLALVTSDVQLLRFQAVKVRPQGRGAGDTAGISLHEGTRVIAGTTVPKELLVEAAVVMVAGSEGSLPGTGGSGVKVMPLDRYPVKGRTTDEVRPHRFLRGKDELMMAWVGAAPPRALREGGKSVTLPEPGERRDGSGSLLPAPIIGIG